MSDYDPDPIMVVYCDGLPDNDGNPTHDRVTIERYVRKWDTAPDGSRRFFWSRIGRADDPSSAYLNELKLRFHCRVCRFDEKRRVEAPGDTREDGQYETTARISLFVRVPGISGCIDLRYARGSSHHHAGRGVGPDRPSQNWRPP